MKKRIRIVGLILILLLSTFGGTAFAQESDTAKNTFSNDPTLSSAQFPNDLYWAGESLHGTDLTVTGDMLGAGNVLNIEKATIGGSFRAAGRDIHLSSTVISRNITAAGYAITIDKETTAAGIYAFGNEVVMNGTCSQFTAFGQTIYLNGTVNGDVTLEADKVIIGDNAKVTGKLKVRSTQKPTVPATASIADLAFEQQATSSSNETVTVQSHLLSKVKSTTYWLIANLAMAALLLLFMERGIRNAKRLTLTATAPLLISGFVAVLAFPLLLLLLCLTVIGIPIAVILSLLLIVFGMLSITFTGSTLSRLVFPNWNPWGASLLGVAILSVIQAIPFLGALVGFAAFVYTLGCLIQLIWQQFTKAEKDAPHPIEIEGPKTN